MNTGRQGNFYTYQAMWIGESLIAQNSDSRKETVALDQTYFAIQTSRMELIEKERNLLSSKKE